MADTKRNLLVFWGGGHSGYFGNEVYALDLNSLTMRRLTDPGPPQSCAWMLADGTPNSRHNYNHMAYISHADKMFLYGGTVARLDTCNWNHRAKDTWIFDTSLSRWTSKDPTNGGPPPSESGMIAEYDPNTRNVFFHTLEELWSYDYDRNTWKRLSSNVVIDYHLTAVIDPKRKLFIAFGGGQVRAFNIARGSWYGMQVLDARTRGCSALQQASYPALAYDPVQDRIVGWAGGDTVYLYDPDTRTCTAVTYPNGPGPTAVNGTFGRFRYFPALNLFAVVNSLDRNAFVLRLTLPGDTPPQPQ